MKMSRAERRAEWWKPMMPWIKGENASVCIDPGVENARSWQPGSQHIGHCTPDPPILAENKGAYSKYLLG